MSINNLNYDDENINHKLRGYDLPNLKLVKKAFLGFDNNSIVVYHYYTKIFEFDIITKKAKALLNCSATSNRQISYCMKFFNLLDSDIEKSYSDRSFSQ